MIGLLAGACVCAPRSSAAADSTAVALPGWLNEIAFNGLLETSFSYNFNRPASGQNQYRIFDFDDNTFKLDQFALVMQKAASKPRESGFRVDLAVGSSMPPVTATPGLFRDETSGQSQDIDAYQAFASYIAPLGSGLRFDAGKFFAPGGIEPIDGPDDWGANATRAFLFGAATPNTNVGVRASYAFSPRVSAMLMVVNGWDLARDDNHSKTVGAELTLTPNPATLVSLTAITGPERRNDDTDGRSLIDVVATLKVTKRTSIGGDFDWGVEHNAVAPGVDATWSGFAGYARFEANSLFALSLRGEVFRDAEGDITGVAQTLTEWTVSPEVDLTPHLLVRGDVRVDRSDQLVFEKSTGVTTTQPTVFLQLLYSF